MSACSAQRVHLKSQTRSPLAIPLDNTCVFCISQGFFTRQNYPSLGAGETDLLTFRFKEAPTPQCKYLLPVQLDADLGTAEVGVSVAVMSCRRCSPTEGRRERRSVHLVAQSYWKLWNIWCGRHAAGLGVCSVQFSLKCAPETHQSNLCATSTSVTACSVQVLLVSTSPAAKQTDTQKHTKKRLEDLCRKPVRLL